MFNNDPKYKKFTEDVANFLQNIRESEDESTEEPAEGSDPTEESDNEEEE